MNNTANALLAAGASPIMAHALEEIDEMVPLCRATVINIGTLDRFNVESMKAAIRRANEVGRPVVLDPVGAGATSFLEPDVTGDIGFGKTAVHPGKCFRNHGHGGFVNSLQRSG